MDDRNIPARVKRSLRQEGGFGCCFCGHPFFEYHHIIPFAERQEHRPADMMIVCPIDHHRATVGALTERQQREAKRSPFNVRRGFADGTLNVTTEQLAVEVGSNVLVGAGFKFVVDGEPLLSLRRDAAGHLLVSLDVFDADDQLLLAVIENEWVTGDPTLWDFEFAYNRLTLRGKEREIAISIDARQPVVQLAGKLCRKGQTFSFRPRALEFRGVIQSAQFQDLALVGMRLEANTVAGTFSFGPDPPLAAGAIVSWPDPGERLRKATKAYRKLIAGTGIGRSDPCLCGSGAKYKHCCGR
jgi:hypothetical protein